MLPVFLAMGLLAARAEGPAPGDPNLPALPAPPPSPGEVSERPLAVPAGRPAAEPPPMDVARLQSMRAYRDRRLTLRPETEHYGGGTHVVSFGGGSPWGWGGWYGGATVYSDPIYTMRTWGVYKGPERLSVSDFLGVVGATERKAGLDHEIGRARGAAKAWFTVAGVGAAGLLGGLAGMGLADNRDEWRLMNTVTFSGSMVLMGGLLGGSFPNAKAARLARYPSASLRADESQDYIDGYNEKLRQELGLQPQDVWAIENREPR